MNRKISIPAIAIVLMLVLLSAGPVFAKGPPEEFDAKEWDRVPISPGEMRITPNGDTVHIRGIAHEAKYFNSQLGEGYINRTFDCESNRKTGEGTCHGKFVITILEEAEPIGTLSGKFVCHNEYPSLTDRTGECTFSGSHGTGALEGYKVVNGECICDHYAGTCQCEGMIIYP